MTPRKLTITLLSDYKILYKSNGTIKKDSLINLNNFRPESDGLYAENIFGLVKEGVCFCTPPPEYSIIGKKCDLCSLEFTKKDARRKRFAHIQLKEPVFNPWTFEILIQIFFKVFQKSPFYYNLKTKLENNKSKNRKSKKNNPSLVFKNILKEVLLYKKALIFNLPLQNLDFYELSIDMLREIKIRNTDNIKILYGTELFYSFCDTEVFNNKFFELSLKINKRDFILENIPIIPPELRPFIPKPFKAKIKRQENLDGEIKILTPFIKENELSVSYENTFLENAELEFIDRIPRKSIYEDNDDSEVEEESGKDSENHPFQLKEKYKLIKDDICINYLNILKANKKRILKNNKAEVVGNIQSMVWNLFGFASDNNSEDGSEDKIVKKKKKNKSILDRLSGKNGRIRRNLLGKRVDYSGRSVIVVDSNININQCKIPYKIAAELFEPFLINVLYKKDYLNEFINDEEFIQGNWNLFQSQKYFNLKLETNKIIIAGRYFIQKNKNIIWNLLEEIIKNKLIILNRNPTLHRLGLQAFNPILTDEKAIGVHPLVFKPFGGDVDGDQMAVFLPISDKTQEESKKLKPENNLFSSTNNEVAFSPSQDIIIGCYILTNDFKNDEKEDKLFKSKNEIIIAYENNRIGIHDKINLIIDGKRIPTTVGRVVFNQIIPEKIGYINETMKKKQLFDLIDRICRTVSKKESVEFLEKVKIMGFEYSTKFGLTIGLDDLKELIQLNDLISDMKQESNIKEYNDKSFKGKEKYFESQFDWIQKIRNNLYEEIKNDRNGFNNLSIMLESGARGTADQLNQLLGIRGLFVKPKRKIVNFTDLLPHKPICNNLKLGLKPDEYFISCSGSRKGLTDKIFGTSKSGYVGRKLVLALCDVFIAELDCKTNNYIKINLKDHSQEYLKNRLLGKSSFENIYIDTGEIILKKNEIITEDIFNQLFIYNIKHIKIRSILSCQSLDGICSICYGADLSTNIFAENGTQIGIAAAHALSEPTTQLFMKTFHTGGFVSKMNSDLSLNFNLISGSLEENSSTKERFKNIENYLNIKSINGIKLSDKLYDLYNESDIKINYKNIELLINERLKYFDINDLEDRFHIGNRLIYFKELIDFNNKLIDSEQDLLNPIIKVNGLTKICMNRGSIFNRMAFGKIKKTLTDAVLFGEISLMNGYIDNVITGFVKNEGKGAVVQPLIS